MNYQRAAARENFQHYSLFKYIFLIKIFKFIIYIKMNNIYFYIIYIK
jgi:hypothetical protein